MGLLKRKPEPAESRPKPFRIELGWRGMFGLVAVCFCLFVWMFLLGIWAGQTILLPPRTVQAVQSGTPSPDAPPAGNGLSNQQDHSKAP